ncbi:hypothetical protein RRG08_066300 [Elysia crispata]|uniref:Uncharacterized protein n=1 Tax=Elysia crispata TaxID=231223 RepID=A0AAE1E199_9GAST|nr:hypothetical protein RRG08_066300 [Elysia crispata]
MTSAQTHSPSIDLDSYWTSVSVGDKIISGFYYGNRVRVGPCSWFPDSCFTFHASRLTPHASRLLLALLAKPLPPRSQPDPHGWSLDAHSLVTYAIHGMKGKLVNDNEENTNF